LITLKCARGYAIPGGKTTFHLLYLYRNTRNYFFKMDALAFSNVYSHMANYALNGTKIGYYLSRKDSQIILVKGVDSAGSGRWLVSLNGEVSYVSPNLYDLLEKNTYLEITGQTLADGTVMSEERARAISTDNLPIIEAENTPRRTRSKKTPPKTIKELPARKKPTVPLKKRETGGPLTEPQIAALRSKDVAVVGFITNKRESPLPEGCSKYIYSPDGKKALNTKRSDKLREAQEKVCEDNEWNLKNTVVQFI
jgi:hypothetical protein